LSIDPASVLCRIRKRAHGVCESGRAVQRTALRCPAQDRRGKAVGARSGDADTDTGVVLP
jgi:hypothetical protein